MSLDLTGADYARLELANPEKDELPRYVVRYLKMDSYSSNIADSSVISLDLDYPARTMILANVPRGVTDPQAALETEFDSLVQKWKRETAFHSSLTKVFAHPAYQRIIAMGPRVLPLVLRELRDRPDRWFYALKFLAGRDVSSGIQDIESAREAWLSWGYRNNYI